MRTAGQTRMDGGATAPTRRGVVVGNAKTLTAPDNAFTLGTSLLSQDMRHGTVAGGSRGLVIHRLVNMNN